LEKDSLPAGVAGAQIRHEIPSAFVAQSLLSAGSFARLARRHASANGIKLTAEWQTRGWKQCPAVRSASSVCFSHLAPPSREAGQIDDPPKDRWDNITFPLDI
jgi:hypothetical protein